MIYVTSQALPSRYARLSVTQQGESGSLGLGSHNGYMSFTATHPLRIYYSLIHYM